MRIWNPPNLQTIGRLSDFNVVIAFNHNGWSKVTHTLCTPSFTARLITIFNLLYLQVLSNKGKSIRGKNPTCPPPPPSPQKKTVELFVVKLSTKPLQFGFGFYLKNKITRISTQHPNHFIGLRAYKNRVDRVTDPICPQSSRENLKIWSTG